MIPRCVWKIAPKPQFLCPFQWSRGTVRDWKRAYKCMKTVPFLVVKRRKLGFKKGIKCRKTLGPRLRPKPLQLRHCFQRQATKRKSFHERRFQKHRNKQTMQRTDTLEASPLAPPANRSNLRQHSLPPNCPQLAYEHLYTASSTLTPGDGKNQTPNIKSSRRSPAQT